MPRIHSPLATEETEDSELTAGRVPPSHWTQLNRVLLFLRSFFYFLMRIHGPLSSASWHPNCYAAHCRVSSTAVALGSGRYSNAPCFNFESARAVLSCDQFSDLRPDTAIDNVSGNFGRMMLAHARATFAVYKTYQLSRIWTHSVGNIRELYSL